MLNKNQALIFGMSGQDGSYIAKLLLDKRYKVLGAVRRIIKIKNFKILSLKWIKIFHLNINRCEQVKKLIKILFKKYDLNVYDNVKINKNFIRPNDITKNSLNPAKLKSFFGTLAKTKVEDILNKLIQNKLY